MGGGLDVSVSSRLDVLGDDINAVNYLLRPIPIGQGRVFAITVTKSVEANAREPTAHVGCVILSVVESGGFEQIHCESFDTPIPEYSGYLWRLSL
ncbi:hypothetical protein KIPB_014593, partial [Kipferlia bialata]|eukprot:g14593.t1